VHWHTPETSHSDPDGHHPHVPPQPSDPHWCPAQLGVHAGLVSASLLIAVSTSSSVVHAAIPKADAAAVSSPTSLTVNEVVMFRRAPIG
jgi:hypothetical protein